MIDISGNTFKGITGKAYTFGALVEKGGQGAVYGEESGKYLIKVLFEEDEERIVVHEAKLRMLYALSLPPRFIKPLDIIKFQLGGKHHIGYVMQCVKGHMPLEKLLVWKEDDGAEWYNETGGLKRRLYLAYLIAQSFALLHENNLAYCDISGKNILVAKETSINSVCMIDIDNIYTPGTLATDIKGSRFYIAPEIELNQLPPDILTDDYSLAVIIFELLRNIHPFIGDMVFNGGDECLNEALTGKHPYIDDENNRSNTVSDGITAELVFNNKLRELFKRSFSDGRLNRMARPLSKEYALACLEASNAVIPCRNEECQAWFFPSSKFKKDKAYECPWCGVESCLLPCLVFGQSYPPVYGSDGNLIMNKPPSYDITFFLRKETINSITANYVRRTLTTADYVTEGTRYETAGNIGMCFVIIFDFKTNIWKIKSFTEKPALVVSKINNKAQRLVKDMIAEIYNGDEIYFDEPVNLVSERSRTSIDRFVCDDVTARTYRMARVRLMP